MLTGSPLRIGHEVKYLEEKFRGIQIAHIWLALNISHYYIKLFT